MQRDSLRKMRSLLKAAVKLKVHSPYLSHYWFYQTVKDFKRMKANQEEQRHIVRFMDKQSNILKLMNDAVGEVEPENSLKELAKLAFGTHHTSDDFKVLTRAYFYSTGEYNEAIVTNAYTKAIAEKSTWQILPFSLLEESRTENVAVTSPAMSKAFYMLFKEN